MSTKRIVVGLGVVLALALGVAFYRGALPPKHGLEGTIGAAKRYQTEQMNAGDVSLSDPDVQDLLQSDLFHQLATDANFRDTFRNQSEALRAVVMSKEYRDVAGRQGFVTLMNSGVYQRAAATNNYELLRNANVSDFRRTQQTSEPLERTSAMAARQKSAEEASARAVLAREKLAKAEQTLDRTVSDLLRTQEVSAKTALTAKVNAAKAQTIQARAEASRQDLAYQNAALALSRVADAAARQTAMAKVENARTQVEQARQQLERTQSQYNMSVADLSKSALTPTSKELLARVESAKTNTAQAREEYARTFQSFDRSVAAVASPDAERTQSATTLDAYAQAQELSRTPEFRRVFEDAHFRVVSSTENFGRLVKLDAFRQVMGMRAFQKVASNPQTWQAIAQVDAERAGMVK